MDAVCSRLYVGDDRDCATVADDWAVVHACKHPCHQDAVGYSGSLPQDHPEYLVAERENGLYLNLVDMDRPLAHEFMAPVVTAALAFIEDRIETTNVLIHCDQGRLRSLALALLYLAKREGAIPARTYRTARDALVERYRGFSRETA